MTWQVLQQVPLTTGNTVEALMFEFPTHKSITSQFTGPVLKLFTMLLSLIYGNLNSEEEFINLIEGVELRLQFSNCVDAVNGK